MENQSLPYADWAIAVRWVMPHQCEGQKVQTRGNRAEAMGWAGMTTELATGADMKKAMVRMVIAIRRLSTFLNFGSNQAQFDGFWSVQAVHEMFLDHGMTSMPVPGKTHERILRPNREDVHPPPARPLPVGPPQPPTSQSRWRTMPVGCPEHPTCQSTQHPRPGALPVQPPQPPTSQSTWHVDHGTMPVGCPQHPTCQSTRHTRPGALPVGPPQYASSQSKFDVQRVMHVDPRCRSTWSINTPVLFAEGPGIEVAGAPEHADAPDPIPPSRCMYDCVNLATARNCLRFR